MNDQSYPTQVPEWFNNATPPSGNGREPRVPKRVLRVVVLITVVVVAIATVPIVNYFSRPACLTADAYHDLTGTNYTESLKPTENFYTTPLTFVPVTATLDTSSASLMQHIADFYKKHESSSIRVVISNFYAEPSDHALTLKRAEMLQSTALKEGVSPKVLSVGQPTLFQPEDDSASTTSSHSVSITSIEGCR